MAFRLSRQSLANRKGVDERLILVNDRALVTSPIDFGIPKHGGLRTAPVQNSLYLAGKSKADGYQKISDHQLAKALDFFAVVNGKASWERHHLAVVAAAHLQAAAELGIKLKWGGLWKSFKDYPHLYLAE